MTNSKIASDVVFDAYTDNQGAVWVATDKGISKFSGGQWTTYGTQNGLPLDHVQYITGDKNENIWASLADHKANFLLRIDAAGALNTYPSPPIWCINTNDPSGTIWLGTNGKGLISFDGETIHDDVADDSPLPKTVADIVFDKEGNKWVATMSGLLYIGKY